MLKISNLSKRYDDTTALEDVSFEINNDEFVVLLGPSGAGKSTLLRCLNNLTTPSSGEITIDGKTLNDSRADVGMVFQQHNLVEDMSAFKNALTGALHDTRFVRSLLGWYGEESKAAALEALQTVGLLEESHQSVQSMSGGQQQRVGIARALVQEPSLMLADEPVASLDPGSAEEVMDCLRRASREWNTPVIASLHQINIAQAFGDRFIGLREGQVVFDGGPSELTTAVLDDLYQGVTTVTGSPSTTPNDSEQPVTELRT
ncbi:phosphonate ABC transporter ATP-binding protein [Haloarcula sp. H-GB4]|uniref:phosphonate ABC transporter ATP-binding protein n=1 Tax=Haloarcula sp. H-GB4 TaxID=3069755 RepID=UPI0027B78584|nr:phosphonate ABC transporter ATP-binding protein [Haloarcula sp. H-GB4]MDQ2074922.1 phosphonate ABC transporter ATP-binding protein [Haloarcula sp. H-GB4]